MAIRIARGSAETAEQAVAEVRSQMGDSAPALTLYFAAPGYDPAAIASAMEAAFAPACVIGCTTAGEIVSGAMLSGALVAMTFEQDDIAEGHIQVIERLSGGGDRVGEALTAFERHTSTPMLELDPSAYVGIILIDGLSGAEERVMDAIGNRTDVTFIGGSAGDDLKFEATHVFANGRAYRDAAVLALLRPTRGFDILKTQSFDALDKQLVATAVDAPAREVVQFNGLPAAVAYADALGLPVEGLADEFMRYPTGLMAGDEPFVRSPQQIIDGRVRFYCGIEEGMTLTILRSRDIVEETRAAVAAKVEEMGSCSAIVNFNCILRTLELQQRGQCEAYGELFTDVPTVGFSTYGEEYLGHINQTATMLLFR